MASAGPLPTKVSTSGAQEPSSPPPPTALSLEEAARERAFAVSQTPRADHVVVVFGYGAPGKGTPSIELKRRLAVALAELDDDPKAIAIVSGEAVHSPVIEAHAMRDWLVAHGIDSERIIIERTARFTAENAQFVAPMIKKARPKRVTLATERFHMSRSKALLERALEAEGIGEVPVVALEAPDMLDVKHRRKVMKAEFGALRRDLSHWRKNLELRPTVDAKLKVPVVRSKDAAETAKNVAQEIAEVIREKHKSGGAVLGLATGSTPLAVYKELVRLHKEEELDFSRVKTFNLDEYYGLGPDDPNSYHRYMQENLFSQLDVPGKGIDLKNVHLPPGDVPFDQIDEAVEAYEKKIEAAGGIDLQLLGIGATGHIGFNEPGSKKDTRTRLVSLADKTREDAAQAFGGKDKVPTAAISMGVGTILDAKRIILMATGEHKASVTRRAAEGAPSAKTPASFLQGHPHAQFFVDDAAAKELAKPHLVVDS
jgi:glucosamine-6-phosphate isomerase